MDRLALAALLRETAMEQKAAYKKQCGGHYESLPRHIKLLFSAADELREPAELAAVISSPPPVRDTVTVYVPTIDPDIAIRMAEISMQNLKAIQDLALTGDCRTCRHGSSALCPYADSCGDSRAEYRWRGSK